MVDPDCQGLGIGKAMGLLYPDEARRDGYLAMKFNFVVSSNTPAVKAWQQLGFEIVGTLPKAFQHAVLGLVDAYVMYRFLDAPG
jgi:ribosomal protein S18 acetylase RimI-like enzyme